jgi:prolyl 4-hydroxylase
MNMKYKKIPKFSKIGFQKNKVPNELYSLIMEEYRSVKNWPIKRDELSYDSYLRVAVQSGISVLNSNDPRYGYYQLSNKTVDECWRVLTPIISDWANVELEPTYQYGIRSYCKDSVLHMHSDIQDTHVVSCIIFISEHPSSVHWPLDFIDHDNQHHQVVFYPGDMLFYESLRPHGRITPFTGNYYRNFYMHWKPVGWNPKSEGIRRDTYKSIEDAIQKCDYDFK